MAQAKPPKPSKAAKPVRKRAVDVAAQLGGRVIEIKPPLRLPASLRNHVQGATGEIWVKARLAQFSPSSAPLTFSTMGQKTASTLALLDGKGSAAAVDAETVEKLALAVAKPGSDALLIDKRNRSAGRMPLPEAARSGRCFAVELRDDMVGLDVDQDDARPRWVMNSLIGKLESRNILMVVENSGTPGHLHLFAPVHDRELKAEIESAAHLFGCDVRAGQRIRPPLSPHRLGLAVGLVVPKMPVEALEALATIERRKQTPSDRNRRGPSGRIFGMLRDGDCDRRYQSRSEMIQAFADAAVNAGLSEAWLLKVLLDEKNRGGEKIQELAHNKGEREALRYVAMVYRNAREFVAARPPFGRRPDVLAKIDEIERAAVADAERWKGRAGATDLAVLNAHLRIMRRCGSLEHGASVREVAILTGINSISTVSAAHSRLECDYLRCVARAKQGASARYLVGLSKFRSRTIIPTGGALGDCSAEGTSAGADAFRWRGGLGKAAWRVWHALADRTVLELSEQLGLNQHSVAKHLRKLCAYDLAACSPAGRWRRLDHLDAAAKKLGIAGEGERQREHYRYEREIYRQHLRHRARNQHEKHHQERERFFNTPARRTDRTS